MSDLTELLSRLRVAEIVLDNLPKDQSQDSSMLIIDSTEAANISTAIGEAVELLTINNLAPKALSLYNPDEGRTHIDYQHFLAYSGLDDSPERKYIYFHGADIGLDKPKDLK